jgi:hypothetical protein
MVFYFFILSLISVMVCGNCFVLGRFYALYSTQNSVAALHGTCTVQFLWSLLPA